MLRYADLKPGTVFSFENSPWVVLESRLVKLQRQKPTLKAKIKNLKTGSIVMQAFTQADTFNEVDAQTRAIKFVYSHRGKFIFSEIDDPSKRMEFDETFVGDKAKYLKPKSDVEVLMIDDEIVDIQLPIKMVFKITECPPEFKGNTATGGTKVATIETGAQITVPMFIEVGDEIVINTEEDKYIERAQKTN